MLLEEQVAPRLDWLAGLRKKSPVKTDREPPRLSSALARVVTVARARAGVAGDGVYAANLIREIRAGQGRDRLRWLGMVIDGHPGEAWDALTDFVPTSHEDRRGLGAGLRCALQGHPGAALRLDARQAEAALGAVVGALEALPPDPRLRHSFAPLLQTIPHLCRAREVGLLAVDAPVVLDAIARLRRLRQSLPAEILRHAERSDARDEPLSLAIEALDGAPVNLPLVDRGS